MKRKIFILAGILSCGVIAFSLHAARGNAQHPDMPQGSKEPICTTCEKDPVLDRVADSNESRYRMNGMKGSSLNGRKLQTDSVQSYNGRVKNVSRVRYPKNTQIQVVLQTDQGEERVILGPSSYVDQSKVKVQAGDKVRVKGYPITANGNRVIMASEVEKNGNILPLRDENRRERWPSNQR